MKMRFVCQGAAVAALVLASSGPMCQAGPLRAGAARVEISPTPAMFPLKDMQNYGSLHDPLYARALVLDNGTTKIALISADSIHFPFGDELIDAVTDELHIPAANAILNATHDHNSPSGGGGFGPNEGKKNAYFDILKNGLVQAAREANANLQPARVGFGTGKAYINVNRDEKIGAGYHMGYNPAGPSDKTVAVLLVTKPMGEPNGGYLAPAHVEMVPGDPVTIPLQLAMINDIALEAVSGEVFTEIGMHMKHDSLFDRTFVVTMLPNGIGYIPNDKAYLLPSEKAIANRIAPGCAEPAMVDAFGKLEKSYLPVWQAAGQ